MTIVVPVVALKPVDHCCFRDWQAERCFFVGCYSKDYARSVTIITTPLSRHINSFLATHEISRMKTLTFLISVSLVFKTSVPPPLEFIYGFFSNWICMLPRKCTNRGRKIVKGAPRFGIHICEMHSLSSCMRNFLGVHLLRT